METAFVLLALAGGGFVLLALLSLSFPLLRGPERGISTRREAARSWRSPGPEPAGRRVLLVGRSSSQRRTDEGLLRSAGYDVRSCAGPDGALETFPYGGCLLLNEERCPLVSGADAIVFGLELDSGAARSVLRGYRREHPDTPVCVRTSDRESEWYARLLRDCQVAHGTSKEDVVVSVGRALDARQPRGNGSGPHGPAGSGPSAHDRSHASSDGSPQAQSMGKGRTA